MQKALLFASLFRVPLWNFLVAPKQFPDWRLRHATCSTLRCYFSELSILSRDRAEITGNANIVSCFS